MFNVMACVITYNPEISLLKENLSALCGQVSRVNLYDNASSNVREIHRLLRSFPGVRLISNKKNLGLPINYNRALKAAVREGCDWLLLMDQDTIICDGMISSFMRYADWEEAAVITPVIWDINRSSFEEAVSSVPKEEYTWLNEYIASASLNRVSTLLETGGFDEKLFIDWVDLHYCKEVMIHGYRILRVNKCIVKHRLGYEKNRQVRFLWKNKEISPHSPKRYYYIFRNMTYYNRKFRAFLPGNPGDLRIRIDAMKSVFWLLYEKDRLRKMRMAVKGIRDGFSM